MREVGVLAAKTHLSALIEQVENGEEVVITRHGRPVARLVPNTSRGDRVPNTGAEIAEGFRALRERVRKAWPDEPAFDWKAAIEEGRE